jgi:hypothetical protein
MTGKKNHGAQEDQDESLEDRLARIRAAVANDEDDFSDNGSDDEDDLFKPVKSPLAASTPKRSQQHSPSATSSEPAAKKPRSPIDNGFFNSMLNPEIKPTSPKATIGKLKPIGDFNAKFGALKPKQENTPVGNVKAPEGFAAAFANIASKPKPHVREDLPANENHPVTANTDPDVDPSVMAARKVFLGEIRTLKSEHITEHNTNTTNNTENSHTSAPHVKRALPFLEQISDSKTKSMAHKAAPVVAAEQPVLTEEESEIAEAVSNIVEAVKAAETIVHDRPKIHDAKENAGTQNAHYKNFTALINEVSKFFTRMPHENNTHSSSAKQGFSFRSNKPFAKLNAFKKQAHDFIHSTPENIRQNFAAFKKSAQALLVSIAETAHKVTKYSGAFISKIAVKGIEMINMINLRHHTKPTSNVTARPISTII